MQASEAGQLGVPLLNDLNLCFLFLFKCHPVPADLKYGVCQEGLYWQGGECVLMTRGQVRVVQAVVGRCGFPELKFPLHLLEAHSSSRGQLPSASGTACWVSDRRRAWL